MKQVRKHIIGSRCKCSKGQIILELNYSLDKAHLQILSNNNFRESKSYTDVGILYVEDANLAASGPFGSNRLQIRCKNDNCDASLANLEGVLTNMP